MIARSSRLLSLFFNGHIFYRLSDILAHIKNYSIGLQQVELYCNVIEKTIAIFDIRLAFVAGLIRGVKKNKSWAMVYWNARDVVQLLDPLICHYKAGVVRCNHCKEALRLINKHWDPAFAAFFHAYHESEKTLR